MSLDAFISYSTHDKPVADATCATLEASGIRCWIAPRDITPGSEWGEAIIDAIHQSRVMILIFSANANNSPQIRREVERAVSKGIPIIPLRIEDIAPARSLEYFIGTVHWLDALTPPLEFHLRRLAESVKTLLQINPSPPHIVVPGAAPFATTPSPAASPVSSAVSSQAPALLPSKRLEPKTLGVGAVAATALAAGLWWMFTAKAPTPVPFQDSSPTVAEAPSQTDVNPRAPRVGGKGQVRQSATGSIAPPPPTAAPTSTPTSVLVEPGMVGSFDYSAVINGLDWRFVAAIAADATYHLTTTQDESGTFQAGNGAFRTVASKTGRVGTGTYRAAGPQSIAVTANGGTLVFQSSESSAPVDQTHPTMIGRWQAMGVVSGVAWTFTVQNNPDGTYHFHAQAEDHGSCVYANQVWRVTSAVTGQTTGGTYRVIDPRSIEFTGPAGPALWHRL